MKVLTGSRGRRVLLVAAGSVLLGMLALAGGCVLFGPEFSPKIATPEMARDRLESLFARFGDVRLHYVRSGLTASETTILFVHGSPGTWDAWRGYLTDPKLAGRARLLALDRPGFGGSARGSAEPSLAVQAAGCLAILDHEGAERAIVVGHSLGGPIAARLAIDAPTRVAGLLLMAPSIDPALERHRWYNVAGSMLAVQWFLPLDLITSNREIWPLRKELEAMAPHLQSIGAPTVVLQGEADDLVPPANADYVERRFTSAAVRIHRLEGGSHFVPWEHPGLVREALEQLLDSGD